jgi:hypothetical protein
MDERDKGILFIMLAVFIGLGVDIYFASQVAPLGYGHAPMTLTGAWRNIFL